VTGHDPAAALELIREALRHPQQVSVERAAELLLSSTGENGALSPARIDAPWPLNPRVGRPRKKSRWHGAYWKNFGQAKARAAAAMQRRVAGASLRECIGDSMPELLRLRIPRKFWVTLLARGTGRAALDDLVPRLTHAFRIRNYAGVRSMLSRSSLPKRGLGWSEHQIRLILKGLQKPL
jgi:hypothetical protein